MIAVAMNHLNVNLIDQIPGCLAWKDRDLAYLGCNQNLARSHQLAAADMIIGMKDNDLGACDESLLFYDKYDQLALTGKIIKVLHSVGSPAPEKSFLLEKKPLLDRDCQIVGILYHCLEAPRSNTLPSLQHIDKHFFHQDLLSTHYTVDSTENFMGLSTRELECLFCLLRGKTAKQSGELLGLSKRTIEFYLENIKNKFGCQSKVELVIQATQAGYLNNVPAFFLRNDLSKLFLS
jgi:DNA-binding CsgD family transcriptional regulator